jgi:hypothetical protein
MNKYCRMEIADRKHDLPSSSALTCDLWEARGEADGHTDWLITAIAATERLEERQTELLDYINVAESGHNQMRILLAAIAPTLAHPVGCSRWWHANRPSGPCDCIVKEIREVLKLPFSKY